MGCSNRRGARIHDVHGFPFSYLALPERLVIQRLAQVTARPRVF
jgi:hypothetical protein